MKGSDLVEAFGGLFHPDPTLAAFAHSLKEGGSGDYRPTPHKVQNGVLLILTLLNVPQFINSAS